MMTNMYQLTKQMLKAMVEHETIHDIDPIVHMYLPLTIRARPHKFTAHKAAYDNAFAEVLERAIKAENTVEANRNIKILSILRCVYPVSARDIPFYTADLGLIRGIVSQDVVLAGGAVEKRLDPDYAAKCATFAPYAESDLDLFMFGDRPVSNIAEIIMKLLANEPDHGPITLSVTAQSVKVIGLSREVHIVHLSNSPSADDIIENFDFTHVQFYWNGAEVRGTKLAWLSRERRVSLPIGEYITRQRVAKAEKLGYYVPQTDKFTPDRPILPERIVMKDIVDLPNTIEKLNRKACNHDDGYTTIGARSWRCAPDCKPVEGDAKYVLAVKLCGFQARVFTCQSREYDITDVVNSIKHTRKPKSSLKPQGCEPAKICNISLYNAGFDRAVYSCAIPGATIRTSHSDIHEKVSLCTGGACRVTHTLGDAFAQFAIHAQRRGDIPGIIVQRIWTALVRDSLSLIWMVEH